MCNLPDKKLKVMIVMMLTGLEVRVEEFSETFNKEIEDIKKNQSMLKNTIMEIKCMLEGINSKLKDLEERINDLKDRVMEYTQAEQQLPKLNQKE